MASTEQLFLSLLRSDTIQKNLSSHLSTSDLCNVRTSSSACCNLLTKRLFTRVHVSFNSNTFTKPSKVAALSRVGHHIEHLTFYFPHSEATFLPPLVHPSTGQEISFLYTPHTSMTSPMTRPKYANTELGDILTQQYPPLFHAATNVPSFINALKFVPNMRHLSIRCPGQDARERYRRDIVDYALISLRIAVERAPMPKLNKLSLSSLHPSAFTYLRHNSGFGTVPSAGRRWKQIKKLSISVEAWDFYGTSPGLDHLKIIDDYIRFFSSDLEKLTFTWLGQKGPCPIALAHDSLFAPPRNSKKLFHEVTSPMSPLPVRPTRSVMHFPNLRYLQVRNAVMNAPQMSALISAHRETVKEFDFSNVILSDKGSWDEALSPVYTDDSWSRSSLAMSSQSSLVTSEASDDLPSPSAAVAAASKELLDLDLGDYGFSDEQKHVIESLSAQRNSMRDSCASFNTKLVKKRVRHRRRKHRDDDKTETMSVKSESSSRYPRRHPKEEDAEVSSLKSRSSSRHSKNSRPSPKSSFESQRRPITPIQESLISAPILNPDPHPVLLQPTVYSPSSRLHKADDISPVQRNLEQEEAHRLLAEDAAARVSALQKAKQAVLSKLSREFAHKKTRAVDAVAAVAACRFITSRDMSTCSREVLEDRRGLESQSLLVPLMFRN